jgi:two-component system cell cycle response regulator
MLSILHVERSTFFQKIVKEIILHNGMNYYASTKVADAISVLDNMHIDLIITGLELEDGSGEELIEGLNRSRHRGLPVFVITSTDSLELRQKLFGLGVVDYLLKQDISMERLSRYLESFVLGDELIGAMKNLRIAVLDDSQVSLGIVQNIFQLNNIRNVSYFNRPEELLDENEAFDMFLVDIVLPGISGEEVIIQLRKTNPDSIILAMSGITNTKTVSNVLLSGADDYIIKPFDAMIFMARLKTNVRVYELLRDLKKKQAVLQSMADYDGMTEIYNHRKVIELLQERMATGGNFAAILFDLDNFKKVNDELGHQVGDRVLKTFAGILRDRFEGIGAVGRYGGEEFLAFADAEDQDSLTFILENLYRRIREHQFDDPHILMRSSAGAAFFRGSAEDIKSLLYRADMALYQAKRDGKDRFSIDVG